jgi:SAM-dependent methyltransferase
VDDGLNIDAECEQARYNGPFPATVTPRIREACLKVQREGFSELVGVEPSTAAIAAAPENRRQWIREGIFREADFSPSSFDLICCFMTMEHVPDPKVISDAAFRLLKPGGAFVTVTHDYRATVNRVLGKRSPIIDIDHMGRHSLIQRLIQFKG